MEYRLYQYQNEVEIDGFAIEKGWWVVQRRTSSTSPWRNFDGPYAHEHSAQMRLDMFANLAAS